MINLKLATILTTIAEISKFDSATNKSILNLSKAARTIRDFEGDVSELYAKGTLKSLPGIDDYAFNLIEEYFTKGRIQLLEDTKKKYSEELLKIVRISGIGTKNAFSIYEALQVKELEDLKKMLSDQNEIEAISCRRNISLNFLDRIAYAIKYFEDTNQRSPRWYAINVSKRIIIDLLRTFKDIESIEFVGSFRRKKPIINDLDILVLPAFNKDFLDLSRSVSLLEKISKLPFIKGVASKDIRKENISYLLILHLR
jgi:DNA polymerase/3'-5' exonuclease PolX